MMTTEKRVFPKAILFDMDGVLIDSQDAWWKAVNDALSCSHHPTITKKEFVDNLWGNDFKKTLSYLGVDKKVFQDCKTWPRTYLNHVNLMNDAVSILSELQETYVLALITNTQRFITSQVLNRFQLTSFFKTVVCADDVENAKPAPDLIYNACDNLAVSVSDVVVVGDTKSDFLACKHAGCIMIGVKFDNGGHIVNNLSELPIELKKITQYRGSL